MTAPNGFSFDVNTAAIEVVVNRKVGSDNAGAYGYYVENTRKKTTVTAQKIWVGGPEVKPTIELQLYRDGEAQGEPVKLANGTLTYSWGELDTTDSAGEDYEYTVKEVVEPENYTKLEEGLKVTNTYVSPKIEITGTKKWVGGPAVKPAIKLQLLRNGEALGVPVEIEHDPLTHTWTDLDLTDKAGKVYVYTVEEVETPDNYEQTLSQDGLTVTNTYVSPKTEVTGTKEWVDGPQVKPTIELQLYRNGEALGEAVEIKDGTTNYTWKNLDLTDKDGEDYKYTVDEVEAPTNYGKSNSEDGLTVTNTYGSPLTDMTGRKVWINGPSPKPTIELQLYRNGEALNGFKVEMGNGTYEYVWKDLEKTDRAGRDYEYTVKEVDTPDNYISRAEGLTVTNTYVSPKTEVTGTKKWVGGPAIKPTIELQLYRDSQAYGWPVKLVDGKLTFTWMDLDLTDSKGVDYTYTVDEVKVPYSYKKSISDDGLTITNTYVPEDDPVEPGGGGGPGPKDPVDPEKPDPTDPKNPEKPEPTDPTDPENPDPADPADPENPEPTDPTDPENPEPMDPVDPDSPEPTDPADPDSPDPTDPPRYRPRETPDPSDPDSPDEFVLIDEDGVPRGKYTKIENPDGSFIYVDEDGIPLGTIDVDDEVPTGGTSVTVPKTGDDMPVLPLAILFIVSLLSAVGLIIVRKKRYN